MPGSYERHPVFFPSIRRELEEVDRRILEHLGAGNRDIRELITPHLKVGGKRLRPSLVLLTANVCGNRDDTSIRYAMIVELIHAASLFHDDVVDNASIRRGSPSANRIMGNHLAILAGDYMYSQAIALIIPDARRIQRWVNDTVLAMTQGEIIQSINRYDVESGKDIYLWVIERKTAKLMELACRLGAVIAGSDDDVEKFAEFGRHLGIAFQIVDDLLDWTSRQSEIGKGTLQDARDGRITLPAYYLMERLAPAEKDDFIRLLQSAHQEQAFQKLDMFRELITSHHIDEAIRDVARKYSDDALRHLSGFPDSPALDELRALPDRLLYRTF